MTKKVESLKILKHVSKSSEISMLSLKGVYKLWHIIDPETIYIGSTSSTCGTGNSLRGFYNRWNGHLSELRRGVNPSVGKLQSVVNEYGLDGIRFSIIEVCDNRMQCRERENYYLKNTKNLYNNYIDVNWSAYEIDLFDMKGNFKGSFPSITDASKRMGIDRASINNAILGNRPSAGGYLWAEKGNKPVVPVKRCITQLTIGGEFVNNWESLEAIKKYIGITSSTAIRNAIKGKQKQAYGFKWIELNKAKDEICVI
jgi:hypothetical protein